MAISTFSLPIDIPWQRIAFSQDMMDKTACDRELPLRWRSSVAIFEYEPQEDQQRKDGFIVSYLKVACTITGFQADGKEIRIQERLGRSGWTNKDLTKQLGEDASRYYACHGAMLEVVAAPPENDDRFTLAKYPYFVDFDPKKRELYEVVTETGETMSRSLEDVNVRLGQTTLQAHEVRDQTTLGAGLSASYMGVTASGSVTNESGATDLSQQGTENIRTTDAAREARETFSHTTQLSQLYHQLNSYHLGSNRAAFYVLPRPHLVQSPATFVNGPREIEGVQEFMLVVVRPKEMELYCVEAYLETAHLTGKAILDWGETDRQFHFLVYTPDQNRRYHTVTTPMEAGYIIDRQRGPQGIPLGGVFHGDTGGYVINKIDVDPDVGTTTDYTFTVGKEQITILGWAEGWFSRGNDYRHGAFLEIWGTVYLKKKEPVITGYEPGLMIAGRAVCSCRKSIETRVTDYAPSIVFEKATATPLKTSYFYDKDDQLRKVLLPRGAQVLYDFDTLGRPTKVTDPHGNAREFVYNSFGDLSDLNIIEDDNGVPRTTTHKNTYDGRGRLRISEYLGKITQSQYDDRDLPIEHRSPAGVTNQIQYDVFGQVIQKVVDPGGLALRSQYEYDLNGQLIRYIDPTGQASVWTQDKLGRTISFQPPDGTTWEYITDRIAQTLEQRMPSGNKVLIEFGKDKSLPTKLVYVAAPGQEAVAPQELHYDGMGRLTSASAGTEVIQRKYDSLNRLIEETGRGKTVRLEFDDVTGTTDLVYPDGRIERTAHNTSGQPTSITILTPGKLGGTAGEMLLQIQYSSAGRPERMSYSNGVAGQMVYDDQGRIIRMEYQKGGTLIDSNRLRYNQNGQRAVVQYLGAPARNLFHLFDDIDRLVEARKDFALVPLPDVTSSLAQFAEVAASQTAATGAPGVVFSLDDADVRLQVIGLNGGATNKIYVSTNDHRLVAVGSNPISYNTDGHRILDAHYRYELDALNRVRRVRDRTTNVIVAELQYDALSRVAAGVTEGQEFKRWFAGSTRIHDRLGTGPGTLRQHSSHPLWQVPFCVVDTGGPAFIHQDEGWSTMCITDGAGAVQERHRYDLFGASTLFAADGATPLSSPKTEPIWRGMPELGKTTLYCTPQRLYDSENGVFISRDPLLYADSPSPYTYSAHNPVDYADWAKTPIAGIPEGQWVKETIIHEEEVHFYEGQNTPPPPPDHKIGFYPLKDADKYLSQQYGDAWETVKSTFKYGPLKNVGDVLGIIEDLDPINAPDHFLSAGSYAKRWVWFSQRGQTGRGLFELFQGHLEASSAVGGVEIGGVLLKGGTALGTAALAKGAKSAEGPKVYSVAMEVHLTPGEVPAYVSDEARRTRHRNIGQDAGFKMIDGWNKSLNPEERELGKRMNELLKNSNDWHLHHDPKRAGVLQLVLTEQHQAPSYQNLFHPLETKPSGRVGRVGGFFTGAAYTNQPLREWTGFLFREDPLQTP